MDINIGDKVRFLNDIGGGIVSGFQKGGIVLVEDADGFEIPMRAAEVVVVESCKPKQTEAIHDVSSVKASVAQKPRKEKPTEPTEEDLRIAELQEYYKAKQNEAAKKAAVSPVGSPISKTTTMGKTTTTNDDTISETGESLEARVIRLEMTVRKLQMRLERLEDAKALREKVKGNDLRQREEKKSMNDPIEIDLHAHEILDTTAGMGAKEIKEYQLKVVRDTMEEYRKNKGRRIVFIHGNGEGVLRNEVIKLLHRNYPTCPFQDASFQQYGFGATMVTIK